MTSLSISDLQELQTVAKEAAIKAGELVNFYADKSVKVSSKRGGNTEASQVVTEVDHRCQTLILDHLHASVERFDLAVLSEELEDDRQRLEKRAFWCIDPLDGTLAFTQSHPGYSVSIALVSKSGEAFIGIVYDPVTKTMYSAIKGQGVYKNEQHWDPMSQAPSNRLSLPCDRSLLKHSAFSSMRQALYDWAKERDLAGLEEKHYAGAVMNACYALENPPAIYFKPPKPEEGGGSFWDFAATACIYKEAGAYVSDYSGNDLNLNRAETTFMNQSGVIYSTDQRLIACIQSVKL